MFSASPRERDMLAIAKLELSGCLRYPRVAERLPYPLYPDGRRFPVRPPELVMARAVSRNQLNRGFSAGKLAAIMPIFNSM